jgi:hypothetical protein
MARTRSASPRPLSLGEITKRLASSNPRWLVVDRFTARVIARRTSRRAARDVAQLDRARRRVVWMDSVVRGSNA